LHVSEIQRSLITNENNFTLNIEQAVRGSPGARQFHPVGPTKKGICAR
jgi:hypothetical protein